MFTSISASSQFAPPASLTPGETSPEETSPEETSPEETGKVQLKFGRYLCVELSSLQHLQSYAESCTGEASLINTGETFKVFRVTACEPHVALRIAKDPYSSQAKKEVCTDCEMIPKLQHKNIVPFLAVVPTKAFGLVEVMPLYNRDLFTHLTQHSYGMGDVLKISLPVCEALEFLHGQSIVHEDIRPENILLMDTDGGLKVVLSDFGFAGQVGTLFLGMSSSQAPEISTFWWGEAVDRMGCLAGVDFPKTVRGRHAMMSGLSDLYCGGWWIILTVKKTLKFMSDGCLYRRSQVGLTLWKNWSMN